MSSFRTLDDLGDITGKVALVRIDLNLRITGVPRASAIRP